MMEKYIIAIDLGGTNLKTALLDSHCNIRNKNVLKTRSLGKKDELMKGIVYSINDILVRNKLKKRDILGIGLGLPGPIDVERGIVHFLPNIPGWRGIKLKNILESKIGLPVFLDNDANLMSLAESRLGAARRFRNVVCVTLGTGVGGGLIIDGRLYRGSTFNAGEIGHIPVNENGPRCNCGGVGCLEVYIGNNKIMQRAARLFGRHISLEELSALSKKADRKARKVWVDTGRYLGIALAGVVNTLNPDCIVIGGGVANAGKVLFDAIKTTLLKRAMSVQAKHVKVFKSSLGNDAGLIGAAILVREKSITK